MAKTFQYVDPMNPGPYSSGDIRFNVNTNMTEVYDGITWNSVPWVASNNTAVRYQDEYTSTDEHTACVNSAKHFSSMMESNGIHRLNNPTIIDAYENAKEAVEQLIMVLSLTRK